MEGCVLGFGVRFQGMVNISEYCMLGSIEGYVLGLGVRFLAITSQSAASRLSESQVS